MVVFRARRRCGFTVTEADESFFIQDRTEGCKYWTPIGVTGNGSLCGKS